MDHTWKQCDAFFFRKMKFRNSVQELIDTVTGRGTTIAGLIETRGGVYSEERLQALIDQLIESMRYYITYSMLYIDEEEDDYYFKPYDLPQDQEAFYRAYLYCALVALYLWQDLGITDGKRNLTGSLRDLAEISTENPRAYGTTEAFLKALYVEWHDPFRTCGLDDCTSVLFRCSLALSDRGQDAFSDACFCDTYAIGPAELEDVRKALTGADRKRIEECREAMRILEEDLAESFDLEEAIRNPAARKPAPDPHKTMPYYRKYKENLRYFVHHQAERDAWNDPLLGGDPLDFPDKISGMIDMYLLTNGKSGMDDAALFYKALAKITNLSRQMRMNKERAGHGKQL